MSVDEEREEKIVDLIKIADEKLKYAYARYSNIRVVSILISRDGTIYYGVNIENASYGLTICAERVAIFKAVSEGKTNFSKILIYSPDTIPWPCGACRQVMSEFFSSDVEVIIAYKEENKIKYVKTTFEELFPGKYRFKIA